MPSCSPTKAQQLAHRSDLCVQCSARVPPPNSPAPLHLTAGTAGCGGGGGACPGAAPPRGRSNPGAGPCRDARRTPGEHDRNAFFALHSTPAYTGLQSAGLSYLYDLMWGCARPKTTRMLSLYFLYSFPSSKSSLKKLCCVAALTSVFLPRSGMLPQRRRQRLAVTWMLQPPVPLSSRCTGVIPLPRPLSNAWLTARPHGAALWALAGTCVVGPSASIVFTPNPKP